MKRTAIKGVRSAKFPDFEIFVDSINGDRVRFRVVRRDGDLDERQVKPDTKDAGTTGTGGKTS